MKNNGPNVTQKRHVQKTQRLTKNATCNKKRHLSQQKLHVYQVHDIQKHVQEKINRRDYNVVTLFKLIHL